MNIKFETMTEKDIENLVPIMKRAFDYDTKIHLNKECGGPLGYDDGSFLRKWGLDGKSDSYCIYCDGILIGGIILWINDNNENYLGNLFIDPEYENKGVGTKVWQKVESIYKETKVWNADTPIFSNRNHNFYINKCGFHVIKIQNPKSIEEGSFVLRKVMN